MSKKSNKKKSKIEEHRRPDLSTEVQVMTLKVTGVSTGCTKNVPSITVYLDAAVRVNGIRYFVQETRDFEAYNSDDEEGEEELDQDNEEA